MCLDRGGRLQRGQDRRGQVDQHRGLLERLHARTSGDDHALGPAVAADPVGVLERGLGVGEREADLGLHQDVGRGVGVLALEDLLAPVDGLHRSLAGLGVDEVRERVHHLVAHPFEVGRVHDPVGLAPREAELQEPNFFSRRSMWIVRVVERRNREL